MKHELFFDDCCGMFVVEFQFLNKSCQAYFIDELEAIEWYEKLRKKMDEVN